MPIDEPLPKSGAANEVWSFGEDVYPIVQGLLFLRERLRPYIHQQMQMASERGLPPMRPLFVDFPDDPVCEEIEDQFMLGPDILVAPVLVQGARQRRVYLPADTGWANAWDNTSYLGGQWIDMPAPLDTIPVFLRACSSVADVFQPSS
jgi:alpha-D-xyloside xylohydrolase